MVLFSDGHTGSFFCVVEDYRDTQLLDGNLADWRDPKWSSDMSGQYRAAKASLTVFGFNVLFDDDGSDTVTPWLTLALREFQAYASMGIVAQEKTGTLPKRWIEGLQPVPNAHRYAGPIDGVLTPAVQTLIEHWSTNKYRCPVVVELFVNNGAAVWPPLDTGDGDLVGNYWRYDDPRIVKFVGPKKLKDAYTKLQVRVCDMSGHFEAPHDPGHALQKIGRLQKHFDFVGAALADSRVIGRESEVLPDVLTGLDWSNMTAPKTQRTFRVVRAVSELECLGYLQSINGYDDAWMSLGPCHWTLALALLRKPPPAATKIGAGELPAFLAYWASEEPADAARVLTKPFGVGFAPTWKKGESGKSADPSWDATRSYTGRMTCQAIAMDGSAVQNELDTFGELDWFRTLHWYWRFLATIRNVKSFRQRQWNMTRLRMRDLLAYQIDPSDRPGAPAGTKTVPVSALITSEAGVALLLRMHVRKSGFVSGRKFNAPNLRLALALAGIAETNPAKWTDTEEQILIEALAAAAAFSGLTPEERKALKDVKLKDLPAHRAALANKSNPTGLRLDVAKLLTWPIASNFTWGPGKQSTPRFALEKAVAIPPLRRTRNSFQFDDSDLPPLPGVAP